MAVALGGTAASAEERSTTKDRWQLQPGTAQGPTAAANPALRWKAKRPDAAESTKPAPDKERTQTFNRRADRAVAPVAFAEPAPKTRTRESVRTAQDDASRPLLRSALQSRRGRQVDEAEEETFTPTEEMEDETGEPDGFQPDDADAMPADEGTVSPEEETFAPDAPEIPDPADELPMPRRRVPGVDEDQEDLKPETERGRRTVNCPNICTSPTDPKLLRPILEISLDLTPPPPVNDVNDKPLWARPEDRESDVGSAPEASCWTDPNTGDRFRGWFDSFADGQVTVVRQSDRKKIVIPFSQMPLHDQRAVYELPSECLLAREAWRMRCFGPTDFTWKASALCHKPLYFEQVNMERYGHSWGPVMDPILSGAHFFATIPILPYKMGIEPPQECVYALGYYRPNSCAPYMIFPFPLSARGALYQAAATTGAILIVP